MALGGKPSPEGATRKVALWMRLKPLPFTTILRPPLKKTKEKKKKEEAIRSG